MTILARDSNLPTSRTERILRKLHRLRRCEWCNRMFPVSKEEWYHLLSVTNGKTLIADIDERLERLRSTPYICKREDCLRSRPEGWWKEVPKPSWWNHHQQEVEEEVRLLTAA